jgi:hypothetical protein
LTGAHGATTWQVDEQVCRGVKRKKKGRGVKERMRKKGKKKKNNLGKIWIWKRKNELSKI